VSKQCDLLGLSKGALYYEPVPETPLNLELMKMIDKQYLKRPFYGSRKMTSYLCSEGYEVNRKRVQRLMRKMGLEAIYPGPNLSKRRQEHQVYPYLLRGLDIVRPNQVWATDVTYIPMSEGFLYLVAVMDLFSRYVLSWKLSNTLESQFCIDALRKALEMATPEIFNTDQGCQFTSNDFTGVLKKKEIKISMDGKGRAFDNIFVERLWRSVKYEEVYLKDYQGGEEAHNSIKEYFNFFNKERPHQALGNMTPEQVYEI